MNIGKGLKIGENLKTTPWCIAPPGSPEFMEYGDSWGAFPTSPPVNCHVMTPRPPLWEVNQENLGKGAILYLKCMLLRSCFNKYIFNDCPIKCSKFQMTLRCRYTRFNRVFPTYPTYNSPVLVAPESQF